MTPEERLERLNLFLVMANQLPSAKNTIDNILRVVRKYDLPKHVDREFIFDCLIAYYQSTEEYENCAELLKYKIDVDRKKRITVKKLTRQDLRDLRTLGFKVPDEIKLRALAKIAKEINRKKDS